MSEWPMVKLGEVARVVAGGTPKTSVLEYWDGDIPWVTPKDLALSESLWINAGERFITDYGLAKSAAALLPRGTVLWSSRAPIGLVAIANNQIATNQGFKSFVPGGELDSEYLAYFLIHQRPILEMMGVGATFKEVSAKRAAEIMVPLPPLGEQKRIAEILGGVSKAIHAVEQQLQLVESACVNSFERKFNLEMQNGVRDASSIADFIASTQYGTSKKAKEDGDIPILRMGNVTYSGKINMTDLKYIDLDERELEKFSLKNGDLLFNRTNSAELVGKTAVFESFSDQIISYAGYLVRARVNADSNPYYVSGYLNSPSGKAQLRLRAKAIVGMANINAREFLSLEIPAATKEEQEEFAHLFEKCEKIRHLLHRKLSLLQELQKSLATRAFAGLL